MDDPQLLNFPFPLRLFRSVEGDGSKITMAFNTLINEINASFVSIGASSANYCTAKQLRKALQQQGTLVQVSSQIPGDVTNDATIIWQTGGTMVTNDPLYSFIQTTLGYTPGQMAALMLAAQGYPA